MTSGDLLTPCHGAPIHVTTTYDVECSHDGCRNSWTPGGIADEWNKDAEQPNPLLVTKMTRIALQILSTAEPRSKVTSPAAELVLQTISSASPKLRRELLEAHLEALDWILKDAFKAQVPPATFSTEPEPEGVGIPTPSPDDRIAYRERVQAVLAAAKAIVPEALAHAFTWGYLAGEADTNPQPASAEFAGMANPFGHFTE